jgi:hypothetical protein
MGSTPIYITDNNLIYKISDISSDNSATLYSVISSNTTQIYNINIPSSIMVCGNSYNVTQLGDNCFKGCCNLISFTIPDTVKTLGSCCFEGCSNLKSIILGNYVTDLSNNYFDGCSSLKVVYYCNTNIYTFNTSPIIFIPYTPYSTQSSTQFLFSSIFSSNFNSYYIKSRLQVVYTINNIPYICDNNNNNINITSQTNTTLQSITFVYIDASGNYISSVYKTIPYI